MRHLADMVEADYNIRRSKMRICLNRKKKKIHYYSEEELNIINGSFNIGVNIL